jgi:ribosomal protein S18 acetylase RimI-like enzyme
MQPPYRIEVLRPDQLGTKELGELDFLSRQLAALESEWDESPINPQFFIGAYLDQLGPEDFLVCLIDGQGRIRGYALVSDVLKIANTSSLMSFVVDAPLRGNGFGRAIMQRALDEIKARGRKFTMLDVNKHNSRAQGLYTSMGFSPLLKWFGPYIRKN